MVKLASLSAAPAASPWSGRGCFWWVPALGLNVGALVVDRVRFRLAVAIVRALAGLGCTAAAHRVYRHEQRRAGRRMTAIRARREW